MAPDRMQPELGALIEAAQRVSCADIRREGQIVVYRMTRETHNAFCRAIGDYRGTQAAGDGI